MFNKFMKERSELNCGNHNCEFNDNNFLQHCAKGDSNDNPLLPYCNDYFPDTLEWVDKLPFETQTIDDVDFFGIKNYEK